MLDRLCWSVSVNTDDDELELVQSQLGSLVFREGPALMQHFSQPQLLDLPPGSNAVRVQGFSVQQRLSATDPKSPPWPKHTRAVEKSNWKRAKR